MTTESSAPGRSMRSARRKVVDTTTTDLVSTSRIGERDLPLVVQPAARGVDLPGWIGPHWDQVESWLVEHGALLLRGFDIATPRQFEAVAGAVCPQLFGEYGDLPKEDGVDRIYHSTPYPHDMAILFHNESSHLPSWPTRQFFYCVQPAPVGGDTPLLDCEQIMQHIDPAIVERMETKRLCYVRNFIPGVDVSWQDFFKTDDRARVESACAEADMTCEWLGDVLRVKNHTAAVRIHPQRGTKVFFNQVQLHHSSCLDAPTRAALLEICGDEIALPRNVLYGDETPIGDDEMAHLNEVFFEHCVHFPWQAGDVIALDNMRVSHARLPFDGPRKINVAMGAMMHSGPGDQHAAAS
jgi:alpha-ketoglutarate-dependent taurine dioxygenase